MAVIKRSVPLQLGDEAAGVLIQKSHRDIYSKAAEWGIATNPLDVEAVIKKFGIRILREEMEPDLSGYIEQRSGGWVIGINKYQTPRRQRFTLAHEFAHFLFDRNQLAHGPHHDEIMLRSDESDQVERRANEFAADLLMPSELFKQQVSAGVRDVAALSDHFDVSMAAIRYRAFKLGYIKKY